MLHARCRRRSLSSEQLPGDAIAESLELVDDVHGKAPGTSCDVEIPTVCWPVLGSTLPTTSTPTTPLRNNKLGTTAPPVSLITDSPVV
jgi:hypothetical protein